MRRGQRVTKAYSGGRGKTGRPYGAAAAIVRSVPFGKPFDSSLLWSVSNPVNARSYLWQLWHRGELVRISRGRAGSNAIRAVYTRVNTD